MWNKSYRCEHFLWQWFSKSRGIHNWRLSTLTFVLIIVELSNLANMKRLWIPLCLPFFDEIHIIQFQFHTLLWLSFSWLIDLVAKQKCLTTPAAHASERVLPKIFLRWDPTTGNKNTTELKQTSWSREKLSSLPVGYGEKRCHFRTIIVLYVLSLKRKTLEAMTSLSVFADLPTKIFQNVWI